MNIRSINGIEHWDLLTDEFTVEAPIDGAPAVWHMRPYAVASAKALLRATTNKFKLLPNGVTESISGDPSAFVSFFDSYFIRMSEVTDEAGNELSLEAQKAWLEDNPQIKADVVAVAYKPEPIIANPDEPKRKAVLTIRTGMESMHRAKCYHNGMALEMIIKHHLAKPSAQDRMEYDRSVSKNRMDARHGTFQVLTDYDLIEKLYNRLILSVDGACYGEKPCANDPLGKIEWVHRVPFWWKAYVIDDIFGQDRIKNA